VVEVAVRDDDALHARGVLLEVFGVWENIVNTWGNVFRYELEAGIENDNISRRAHLDCEHIATDFFDTAEGDNADGG
jgi:hypothetical protein